MSRWAATSASDWGRYFSTQGVALASGVVPATTTFLPLFDFKEWFWLRFWFSSSSMSIRDTTSVIFSHTLAICLAGEFKFRIPRLRFEKQQEHWAQRVGGFADGAKLILRQVPNWVWAFSSSILGQSELLWPNRPYWADSANLEKNFKY